MKQSFLSCSQAVVLDLQVLVAVGAWVSSEMRVHCTHLALVHSLAQVSHLFHNVLRTRPARAHDISLNSNTEESELKTRSDEPRPVVADVTLATPEDSSLHVDASALAHDRSCLTFAQSEVLQLHWK